MEEYSAYLRRPDNLWDGHMQKSWRAGCHYPRARHRRVAFQPLHNHFTGLEKSF